MGPAVQTIKNINPDVGMKSRAYIIHSVNKVWGELGSRSPAHPNRRSSTPRQCNDSRDT